MHDYEKRYAEAFAITKIQTCLLFFVVGGGGGIFLVLYGIYHHVCVWHCLCGIVWYGCVCINVAYVYVLYVVVSLYMNFVP